MEMEKEEVSTIAEALEKQVECYERARAMKEIKEMELSSAVEELRNEEQKLHEFIVNLGQPSVTIGSYKYIVDQKDYYNFKGDKDILFKTLRRHKLGGIIQSTINANTFNATLRGLKNPTTGDLPIWLRDQVETYTKEKILRRKTHE